MSRINRILFCLFFIKKHRTNPVLEIPHLLLLSEYQMVKECDPFELLHIICPGLQFKHRPVPFIGVLNLIIR